MPSSNQVIQFDENMLMPHDPGKLMASRPSSAKPLSRAASAVSMIYYDKKFIPKRRLVDRRSTVTFSTEHSPADIKLARLQSIFDEAERNGEPGLSPEDFQSAYRCTMDSHATDDDIDTLFMKIDANCDGTVEWEEFVTYSLLEYQEKTVMLDMLKEKPFPTEARPVKSRHHDIIVKITFFPNVPKRPTGSSQPIDFHHGRYVSLSKDGLLAFWTMEMRPLRSYSVEQQDRATQPWLTDMACMYNMNMLAVASTDRDITIYDLANDNFVKKYFIAGLENCITCMAYFVYPRDTNRSVMLWGDTGGNVYAITFDRVFRKGPFGPVSSKGNRYKRISLAEILRGLYKGVTAFKILGIHDDWVCSVKFIHELDMFMSCSQNSETAMYLGDLDGKKTKANFKVNKGVLCFDYCPHHNVIATGGMDYFVRVWNPYVNSKCIVLLKGHSKPITNVFLNGKKHQIISIDRGKSLRVFDLRDQACLQNISGRTIKMGPLPITTVSFNPTSQMLILGTNQITVLQKKIAEDEIKMRADIVSHDKPVFRALYNQLFDFVVSACEDSVVSIWNVKNGEKIIQFANAHKIVENGVEIPIEITAMSFDLNGRRLVTGAKNGTVKVWNFNNGACLREYDTGHGLEITGIVCTKRRIYVTGWHRHVIVFPDGGDLDETRVWSIVHKEDVLCMAYLNPNVIATGSYDGFINVWSRDTGQVLCTFNAHKSCKALNEITASKLEAEKGAAYLSGNGENKTKSQTESEIRTEEQSTSPTAKELEEARVSSITKTKAKVKARALGFGFLGALKGGGMKTTSESSSSSDMDKSVFEHPLLPALVKTKSAMECSQQDKVYTRQEYDDVCKTFEAAIEKIIFLETREFMERETACLVTAGAEGWVRAWSTHHQGGLLGQFNAAHILGEGVFSLATDENNKYLITADTSGYVKVWCFIDYCTKNQMTLVEKQKHITQLKTQFPYLRIVSHNNPNSNVSETNFKRAAQSSRPAPMTSDPDRTLKIPLLLNSFRAHIRTINNVDFCNGRDLIVTASADCSVRLWTICGRYVGTFGDIWKNIPRELKRKDLHQDPPPELRRTGSARTLKVLNAGNLPHWRTAFKAIKHRGYEQLKAQFAHLQPQEEKKTNEMPVGDAASDTTQDHSNILGRSYQRKTRHRLRPRLPKIIETPGSMAVFRTLPFAELTPLECLHNPKVLDEIRNRRLIKRAQTAYAGKTAKAKASLTDAVELYTKLIQKPTICSTTKAAPADQMKNCVTKLDTKVVGGPIMPPDDKQSRRKRRAMRRDKVMTKPKLK